MTPLHHPSLCRRLARCRPLELLLLAVFLGTAAAQTSRADDEEGDAAYVRIEEDWMLKVNDPDRDRGAPQVAAQMAPGPQSRYFCVFQINYRELPDVDEGGLQVQLWKDGQNADWKSAGSAALGTRDETITWTQSMERDGAELQFKIKSGSSTTWGDLADAELRVSTPDGRSVFASYSSAYSAEKSGITYGANRVQELVLVEVRKYKANGSCDKETTPRTVYQESTTAP